MPALDDITIKNVLPECVWISVLNVRWHTGRWAALTHTERRQTVHLQCQKSDPKAKESEVIHTLWKCQCCILSKNIYAVTHHSVGSQRLLHFISCQVHQVSIIREAVYPVANRDYKSQEGNHIHGQTHSHLAKMNPTKLSRLMQKIDRVWVNEKLNIKSQICLPSSWMDVSLCR